MAEKMAIEPKKLSPLEWSRLIDGQPSFIVAGLLVDRLKGYRQTSLSRADDRDMITALLDAMKMKE